MSKIRTEIIENVDYQSGVITRETNTVKIHNEQSEKFAMLFLNNAVKLFGMLNSESKLFVHMLMKMDGDNIVQFTPAEKQEFILEHVNKKATNRQAGVRFYQLLRGILAKKLAIKINSYKLKINPEIVSFGYNGTRGIQKIRADYLKLESTVDLETGKIETKLMDGRCKKINHK